MSGKDAGSVVGADRPATARQLRYLQVVAREAGLADNPALDARAVQEFGVKAAALSRWQANRLIEAIEIEGTIRRIGSADAWRDDS